MENQNLCFPSPFIARTEEGRSEIYIPTFLFDPIPQNIYLFGTKLAKMSTNIQYVCPFCQTTNILSQMVSVSPSFSCLDPEKPPKTFCYLMLQVAQFLLG
jgi:hypothetical protein